MISENLLLLFCMKFNATSTKPDGSTYVLKIESKYLSIVHLSVLIPKFGAYHKHNVPLESAGIC